MKIIINWLLSTLIILIVAYVLPGVYVSSFTAALLAALVIGVINAIIRPILIILTLPINIITLGLFTLVINALLLMLAAAVVPGLSIDSFLWAIVFSIFLFIFNVIAERLFNK